MKRSKKTKNALRAALALLLAAVMMALAGCGSGFFSGDATTPQDSTDSPDVTTRVPSNDTTAPNADETTAPFGDDTTLPPEDTTTGPDEPLPTYIDPLTGLEGLKDVTAVRPVALFYDNLSSAAPQSGIAKADVLIEVMVEGGISRLIAITNDYDNDTDNVTKDESWYYIDFNGKTGWICDDRLIDSYADSRLSADIYDWKEIRYVTFILFFYS